MDSLAPEWLLVEVESIDDSASQWSDAIKSSYEASHATLTENPELLASSPYDR